MFESDDIKRLCAEVRHFSVKGNLTWKGLPVLVYEFVRMSDFHTARRDILAALSQDLLPGDRSSHERLLSPDMLEIDCYGVTLRLICKQMVMTRHGPYGTAELR